MPTPGRPFLAFLALLLLPALTRAATPTPAATPAPAAAPKSRFDQFESAGVKLVRGPATVPLGQAAELKVPAGFAFVGADGLDKFYELTENSRSGKEVGVLMAPKDWMLFLDYSNTGYIKDEEKNSLDASKLMTSMTADETESNDARKKRGWDAMKITGWATPPHYDEKSHNLKWAINLTSSRDNFKTVFINESIRLLGRGGVMEVTLVTGTGTFQASETAADALLASNFGYVAGQKYSEWKSGDKIAAYGLGALVLGGAGVLATKAGLFAKLGVFFAKFFKLILLAAAAVGAFFVKLWKKITGRV